MADWMDSRGYIHDGWPHKREPEHATLDMSRVRIGFGPSLRDTRQCDAAFQPRSYNPDTGTVEPDGEPIPCDSFAGHCGSHTSHHYGWPPFEWKNGRAHDPHREDIPKYPY